MEKEPFFFLFLSEFCFIVALIQLWLLVLDAVLSSNKGNWGEFVY